MEPAVIVIFVTICVLIVFGCGVFLGRSIERRHWERAFRRYAATARRYGDPGGSAREALAERRRLLEERGPRVGVDPETGGEACVEQGPI